MIEVMVHLVLERRVQKEDPHREKLMGLGCYSKKVILPFSPAIGMTLRMKDLTEYFSSRRFYEIKTIQLFDDRDLASVYIGETFKEKDPRFEKMPSFLLSKGWILCTSPRNEP